MILRHTLSEKFAHRFLTTNSNPGALQRIQHSSPLPQSHDRGWH